MELTERAIVTKKLTRRWWVRAAVALVFAAVSVQNVVHPFSWPHPMPLLAVICPAFAAVVVAATAKEAWEITRRREPRIVGLTGFRRVLEADLASATVRQRSPLGLADADGVRVISWYRKALRTATTPAAAEDLYREWQIIRPAWLGRGRGNVIFDPACTD